MNNGFKRFLLVVFSIIVIFTVYVLNNNEVAKAAYVMPPTLKGLSGGVQNKYYYISTNNLYSNITIQGVYDWNNSVAAPNIWTPIWFTKTTLRSKSVVDIFVNSNFSNDWLAQTTYYVNSTNINPHFQKWYWAKIEYNTARMQFCTAFERQGTAAHEFGHAIGLDEHNSNPGSIMCQLKYDRYVNKAQSYDLLAVAHLYGY